MVLLRLNDACLRPDQYLGTILFDGRRALVVFHLLPRVRQVGNHQRIRIHILERLETTRVAMNPARELCTLNQTDSTAGVTHGEKRRGV